MSKLYLIFLLCAVLGFAGASIVIPQGCTTGAGSSVSLTTYVTNLTLVATQLTENPPYNLTAGAEYNVTFTFVVTSDVPIAYFNVTGTFVIDGQETTIGIASASVGSYTAPTVGQLLANCPLGLLVQLVVKCGVGFLNLSLPDLVSCAGDQLINAIVPYIPSTIVGTATVLMTVPGNSVGVAVFRGIVSDANGKVVACRQGNVIIIAP